MYTHTVHAPVVPVEVRRHQIPWCWSYGWLQTTGPGNRNGSSVRAASVLQHWTIFPAQFLFLMHKTIQSCLPKALKYIGARQLPLVCAVVRDPGCYWGNTETTAIRERQRLGRRACASLRGARARDKCKEMATHWAEGDLCALIEEILYWNVIKTTLLARVVLPFLSTLETRGLLHTQHAFYHCPLLQPQLFIVPIFDLHKVGVMELTTGMRRSAQDSPAGFLLSQGSCSVWAHQGPENVGGHSPWHSPWSRAQEAFPGHCLLPSPHGASTSAALLQ